MSEVCTTLIANMKDAIEKPSDIDLKNILLFYLITLPNTKDGKVSYHSLVVAYNDSFLSDSRRPRNPLDVVMHHH